MTIPPYKLDKVTRVEVIDHSENAKTFGRAYVNMDCHDVELSLQDDMRTLKIFIR